MKKTVLFLGALMLTAGLTFTSCSKKSQEESKEAAAAVKEDVKDAAADVKEGVDNVATDVKDAAAEAGAKVSEKVSKLSKSAKLQYDAFEAEVKRLDGEIAKASEKEKAKLEKTRQEFVKKRDKLLEDIK